MTSYEKMLMAFLPSQIIAALLILLLAPPGAWAQSPRACTVRERLEALLPPAPEARSRPRPRTQSLPESLEGLLHEVPELRTQLQDVLDDPKVPASLRQGLRRALEKKDLTVHRLTTEFRSQWNIPSTTTGFHSDPTKPFEVVVDGAGTANAQASSLTTFRTDHPTIVVGHPGAGSLEELITLVHELAHVRFNSFLTSQLPQLAAKWPRFISRSQDGRYRVSEAFYSFLAERYAFETEARFVKQALAGPSRRKLKSDLAKSKFLALSAAEQRRLISGGVIKGYKITDPGILELRDLSLSEILRGRGAPAETTETIRRGSRR